MQYFANECKPDRKEILKLNSFIDECFHNKTELHSHRELLHNRNIFDGKKKILKISSAFDVKSAQLVCFIAHSIIQQNKFSTRDCM